MLKYSYDIVKVKEGYLIQKNCYWIGMWIWTEYIGEDGGSVPFLTTQDLEEYLKTIKL